MAVPDASLPEWITPMAAKLTQDRFTDPEWSFERKFDGIRLLSFKRGTEVHLYSRNRLRQDCPTIARAIAGLPARDLVLDGELTWSGSEYHVFDVPWLDGRDLRPLPLAERRLILDGLPLRPPLHRVAELDDDEPWELARLRGWEG